MRGKKKVWRGPSIIARYSFLLLCVLLNKLLIVYILYFIIYLEEDFFFLKDLVVHIQI